MVIPRDAGTQVAAEQVSLSESMVVVDPSESAEKFVLVKGRGDDHQHPTLDGSTLGEGSSVQSETPQATEPNQVPTATTTTSDASEHAAVQSDDCEGQGYSAAAVHARTNITATRTAVKLVSVYSLEDFVCVPLTKSSSKASPGEMRCAFPLLTERDLDPDFPSSQEPWELSWPSSAEQHFFEIIKDKEQFELEVIGPAEEDGCVLVKLVWNTELDVRDAVVSKIRDRGQRSLQSLQFENILEGMIEEGVDYLEGTSDEDTAVEENFGQDGGDHSTTDGGGDYIEDTADTVGANHEHGYDRSEAVGGCHTVGDTTMEENIAKHRYGEDESEAVVSQGCYDKEFEGTTDGDHKDLITAQENTQDDAYKNKENDFVVADEETVEASNKDDTPPCKEPQSIVVTTEHKGDASSDTAIDMNKAPQI